MRALDAEARRAYGGRFRELSAAEQDALLQRMQRGELQRSGVGRDAARDFLQPRAWRMTSCWPTSPIPTAWSEIGWGGPASPRGYVRMDFDQRDPWEAAEAPRWRSRRSTAKEPPCRMIRCKPPRAVGGRAPDVFRPGGWIPMRTYRDDEEVDFAIVGTGAGGGTLACKLAEAGFSVVALMRAPYWRPLEDFASDESEQTKLYWTDDRIVDGENPLQLGSNNSGKAVGGSTVHFAMVSLRFRPEWFKSRTQLGYGVDWPLDWREMWHYYARGRGRAEDRRTGHLSVGSAPPALSVSRA